MNPTTQPDQVRPEPLDVTEATDCPRCGSPAGQLCEGARGPRTKNHAERVNAHRAAIGLPAMRTPEPTTVRDAVRCYVCGADRGEPCKGTRGPRSSNHRGRIQAFQKRRRN